MRFFNWAVQFKSNFNCWNWLLSFTLSSILSFKLCFIKKIIFISNKKMIFLIFQIMKEVLFVSSNNDNGNLAGYFFCLWFIWYFYRIMIGCYLYVLLPLVFTISQAQNVSIITTLAKIVLVLLFALYRLFRKLHVLCLLYFSFYVACCVTVPTSICKKYWKISVC